MRPADRAGVRFVLLTLLVAAPGAATATAAEDLFLWETRSPTATITLVGSIHVGQPDFFPLAAPFEEAFAAAPALAVEVDISDPATVQKSAMVMMQRGLLPGSETLQTRLEPAVWDRLEAYAKDHGTSLAPYMKLKPGLVAMMLVMEEYQRQGFDPELGIDQHFLTAAKTAGKQIRSIETIEDQLDLFLDIDDTLDDILVSEFLDQTVDVQATIDEMIGFWQTGDADGLDRLLQEQIGDTPEMQAFYRTLLDDRNVAMADSIDAWLDGSTDVFVVVGAGHFAGEHGIVSLLRGKGREVVQVGR